MRWPLARPATTTWAKQSKSPRRWLKSQYLPEPNARLFWHSEIDRVNPFTHKTVLARSRALLDLDRKVEARIGLEEFLKEKPDWRTAEVTKQLARTWTIEDGVKARAFLKESIRSKPAPDTYILLGNLEQQRSNRSNAIDAYLATLQLDPQLVDIREKLAGLLLKMASFKKRPISLSL